MAIRKSSRTRTNGQFTIGLWSDTDGDLVVAAILHALKAGGSVNFSRTKDGKSVIVTLYHNDQDFKEYCQDTDELNETMCDLADMFGGGEEVEAETTEMTSERRKSRKA